ncbi:cytochrome P450 [Conexibacter sp. CPCC 206217]|uniref:cytochrome P450 n=1 Tax=Conexibacter sp. CPCC 206217 TaxID=3064574 RepID=UPI00271DEA0E|nr:cytochrome P450 [Conexibacter sp. CPCC 206217]MDO8211135.1 cytochrome P450 [Conexibacter sp. CPCC 206217]
MPAALQTIGWWTRPLAYTERLRARYGPRFTMRLAGQPPFVVLTDPADLRALFTAPPDVLHPGEGARLLEPIVGPNSVILLDGATHLEQRKLMLPAFHGDRMQRLTGLMQQLTERELDGWPVDAPVELHPRLQRLTLEIILRAVFGLDEGERLDLLRDRLPAILSFGDSPISLLPQAQRLLRGRGTFGRFERARAEVDRELFALIEERRREDAERDDVLAMLLAARHSDGSPMTDEEIRDELVTALVAGHETTASSLGFAFEQLARSPEVQERLAAEAAEDGDDYLDATINEVMRRRPVLPNPEPRLVKQEVTIGGWTYPAGVVLIGGAYLVHHDPQIYPDPYAFRPERFLASKPGTYTWLPFGGGRRRCLGASFALLEMRLVLRAASQRFTVAATGPRQGTRRRMITITPGDGARVVLSRRTTFQEDRTAPTRQLVAR